MVLIHDQPTVDVYRQFGNSHRRPTPLAKDILLSLISIPKIGAINNSLSRTHYNIM